MPSNPERLRPTPLLDSEIGARVRAITLAELLVIKDEVTTTKDHPIKGATIIDFIKNKAGEYKVPKSKPA